MNTPEEWMERRASEPFRTGAMDLAGTRIVWAAGELDLAGEDAMKTTLEAALVGAPASIVLDLRSLSFADCTAIRCIEFAHDICRAAGLNLYVDPGDIVRRLADTLEPRMLGPAGWLLRERSLDWSEANEGSAAKTDQRRHA